MVREKERKREEKKSEIGNPKTNLKWLLLLQERERENDKREEKRREEREGKERVVKEQRITFLHFLLLFPSLPSLHATLADFH